MRAGDLVQSLAELGQCYDQPIECIAVDVVFHAELCDLLSPRAKHFWRQLVQQKNFLGLVGSPPCETWSVARWRYRAQKDFGPKPVRTLDNPWVLPSASVREI